MFHTKTIFIHLLSLSSSFSVRLGDSDLWSDIDDHSSVEMKVADFIIHPNFVDPFSYFDVGLLKLPQKIAFSDFILPVCLPTIPVVDLDENEGRFVTLTGWGKQDRLDITAQKNLKRTKIGIFSQMCVHH